MPNIDEADPQLVAEHEAVAEALREQAARHHELFSDQLGSEYESLLIQAADLLDPPRPWTPGVLTDA